jgi:hypothetical protein
MFILGHEHECEREHEQLDRAHDLFTVDAERVKMSLKIDVF